MLVALRRRIARPAQSRVVTRALYTPTKAVPTPASTSTKRTFSDLAAAAVTPKSQGYVPPENVVNPEDEVVPWWRAIAWAAVALGIWIPLYEYSSDAFHYPTGFLNENPPAPPHWHWPHSDYFGHYDNASLRRGYDVYRQVCAQCHSMNNLAFRQLIDVTHTEAQVKELAGSISVVGGYDDNGDEVKRPGSILDHMPNPYKNEAQARGANGGALPPDLSLRAYVDHHGPDYLMALLVGYNDKPPGVADQPGKHWNTYFDGGWISMPPPLLVDEQVEYDDGTPATKSQMAKDVTHFLTWAYNKGNDEHKNFGVFLFVMVAVTVFLDHSAMRHRFLGGFHTALRYSKPKIPSTRLP